MKKISLLALTLILALVLAACSASPAPEEPSEGPAENEPSSSGEGQELVFGSATLTYAEFFSGDVSSTESFDAVTSATTSKYEIMPNMATDFVDETANADGFIRRLPEGYHTMLTGDGANLSQGQRQLLSIARAAVKDPPIMVLDAALFIPPLGSTSPTRFPTQRPSWLPAAHGATIKST